MRQSVHIFLKDARYLRIEIGLFVVFSAIFAWVGARSVVPNPAAEILLEVAAVYLIVRAVHAELVPGDRQFWLTRPYHRMSLAGAKLLFIAVFVCAPICAAQIVMLISNGFPLLPSLSGLLWSQLLIFVVGSILVAALAAVTTGTVIFMLSALILAGAVLIGEVFVPFIISGYQSPVPSPLEWVRQYFAMAILSLTGASVLFWQYRHRATDVSRAGAVGGIILAAVAFLWIPSTPVLALQSWLKPRPVNARSIEVSVDPSVKGNGTWFSGGRDPLYRRVRIPLPIALRGLPEGVEARPEVLSASLEWPGNRTWKPDVPPGLNPRSNAPGVSIADATILMNQGLYFENRNLPVIVTGAVYITLFGDTESRTLMLGNRAVNFQDGLQCLVGEFNFFYCRSFFRWPASLVYAESGGAQYPFRNISYSPFPANAGLNFMEARSGGELKASKLTVITKKPIAHFWTPFQTRGLRLADFEGPEPLIPRPTQR